MHRAIFPSAALVSAALLAGCSDPYTGREAVTGTITLEGQPLNDATITFESLDGQGTVSGAAVVNGAYSIDRKAGLKPGKYRVMITAGDGVTPNNEEEAGGPGGSNIVSVDRIPAEYNERSQQQVEVKADAPNKFDFAIPKARVIPKRK